MHWGHKKRRQTSLEDGRKSENHEAEEISEEWRQLFKGARSEA